MNIAESQKAISDKSMLLYKIMLVGIALFEFNEYWAVPLMIRDWESYPSDWIHDQIIVSSFVLASIACLYLAKWFWSRRKGNLVTPMPSYLPWKFFAITWAIYLFFIFPNLQHT